MWGVRNAGAAALAIVSALCMSACTALEGLEPPPLETAFHPLPPPAEPPVPIPQSRTPPAPGSARAEIATWLSANGYRDFQVAALMQLADTESGFRPCVIGPGGYHYLYQWGGTRRGNCASTPRPPAARSSKRSSLSPIGNCAANPVSRASGARPRPPLPMSLCGA